MKQPPRTPDPAGPATVGPGIETLLRVAAEETIAHHQHAAAEQAKQSEISRLLEQMKPFQTALAAAREAVGELGRKKDAALDRATQHRQDAVDLAQRRGVSGDLFSEAELAAQTAAATPPPPSGPFDTSQWTRALCACGQPIIQNPATEEWNHPATGLPVCDDTGRFATPISPADALGQNGQYPVTPEGAPR